MVEVTLLAASHDDVDVEVNQLCREFGQPFDPILRIAALDDNVFSFTPSQLRQGIEKIRNKGCLGTRAQEADHAHLRCLLRAARERPSCYR
jgi:hypothetical protein